MDTEYKAVSHARRAGTWAIVGICLYVVLDVVAQLLPPHYSPIHQAESDLAVGPYGYLMRINFVVRGALSLAVVSALATTFPRARARWGLILFGIWGVTSGLLAVFNTDILDDRKVAPILHLTRHGELHLALAFIGFVAAPVGAILIAQAFSKVPALQNARNTSMTLAVLSLIALLAMAVFPHIDHAGGLGERIYLLAVLLWTLHAAVSLRRAASWQQRGQAVPHPA